MTAPRRTAERLSALFPAVGPWTTAALWAGLAPQPVPTAPIDDELDELLEQRLGPLALRWITDERIDVQAAVVDRLRTDAFTRLQLSLLTTRESVRSIEGLRGSGVDCVVSKGPGIAALYPSADLRPFIDLDVLVSPADFPRAMGYLQAVGYEQEARMRQPWRVFDRRCREGVNLRSASGGSVDLHHHVPPWFWARRLDTSWMTRTGGPVDFYGNHVACLPPELNLLVAALHVVSDKNLPGRSLLVWRDLAQTARAVDLDAAVECAQRTHLSGWLRAVLLALPPPVQPTDLLARLDRSPHVQGRARILLLLKQRKHQLSLVPSQLLRLPAPNALLYAGGMAVPSRTFLAGHPDLRPATYRSWWRQGLRIHSDAGRLAATPSTDKRVAP